LRSEQGRDFRSGSATSIHGGGVMAAPPFDSGHFNPLPNMTLMARKNRVRTPLFCRPRNRRDRVPLCSGLMVTGDVRSGENWEAPRTVGLDPRPGSAVDSPNRDVSGLARACVRDGRHRDVSGDFLRGAFPGTACCGAAGRARAGAQLVPPPQMTPK
jgi:hypothetical protein